MSRHFCHFLIHASRTRLRFGVAVNGMRAIHPGETLREDYLKPLGMSANALSKSLHVPPGRVNYIVRERRGATVNSGWIPSNLKLSGL